MTYRAAKKALKNIDDIELSGRGQNWEVECSTDESKDAACAAIPTLGGYMNGWGGWNLRNGYKTDGLDYCDRASSMHY